IWPGYEEPTGRGYFGVHYVARYNGPGATNPQSPTGKRNFRKSLAVTQVLRAIKKKASKNKTPDWPRDPLPIIALRYYMDVPPHRADISMYKRDIALVALGLRTIRRPGELGNQFKNGRFIPVENTGSKYCP
ncbi:15644_t:CDS:2, partial [Racocetra persica]